MSDKIPPRFRRTKSDKWAVMAPVEDLERALAEGGRIDVQKRSGDWSTFKVASLGKPFDVDGVKMCYGYGPEEDGHAETTSDGNSGSAAQPRRSSSDSGRRGSSGRPRGADHEPPPVDQSEPLPEYQGGPEDEWDGGF